MTHNGGLLQVNLDFASPYFDYWAIDAFRMAFPFNALTGGDAVPLENWPLNLDADGYPIAMPGGTGTKWSAPQFWIYGDVGDTWDLFYPTTATATLLSQHGGFSISSATIAAGHKRYTITATPADTATGFGCYICSFEITAMSAPIVVGDLKCYRTEHQALVDAGEWLNPLFLARLGYPSNGFGKIRWMNGQHTNTSLERSAANRKQLTNLSWIWSNLNKDCWAGTCTKTLNAYTTSTRIPTLPVAWTDGQVIQFRLTTAPTVLASTNITRGAITTIQFTGAHGLSNGDPVCFANRFNNYPSGWAAAVEDKQAVTGLPPDFAVTVTAADTITIALNSSGFAALSSASLWPVITVTDGTLPAKRMYSTLDVVNLGLTTLTTNTCVSAVYNSTLDCLVFNTDATLNIIKPGVPVEVLTAIANKIEAHCHYCFPVMASSAYRQTVAATISTGAYKLNTGLTPYFEQENEPWNTAFGAYRYNKGIGAMQTGGSPDWRYGHHEKVLAMKADIGTVFGSSRPYKISLNYWNVNTDYDGWLKGNPAIHGGDSTKYVGNNIDSLEVAPYYQTKFNYSDTAADYTNYKTNLNLWLTGTTANKNTAFEWFAQEMISGPSEPSNTANQQVDEHINTYIPQHLTALASYTGRLGTGVELQMYEGGPHTVGPDQIDGGFPVDSITVQNVRDFYFEYLASSQHADVEKYYYQHLLALGVKYPSRFTITAPWAYDQLWGAYRLNSYPATPTLMYTMLRYVNDGSPSATTSTPTTGGSGGPKRGQIKPPPRINWNKKKKHPDPVAEVVDAVQQVAKVYPDYRMDTAIEWRHIANLLLADNTLAQLRKIESAKVLADKINQAIEEDDEDILLLM